MKPPEGQSRKQQKPDFPRGTQDMVVDVGQGRQLASEGQPAGQQEGQIQRQSVAAEYQHRFRAVANWVVCDGQVAVQFQKVTAVS
jgi:hypothetical protein